MFAGQVIVGATVSPISKINEQLATLPPASVTVTVTLCVPGFNIVPVTGVCVNVKFGQLSSTNVPEAKFGVA